MDGPYVKVKLKKNTWTTSLPFLKPFLDFFFFLSRSVALSFDISLYYYFE